MSGTGHTAPLLRTMLACAAGMAVVAAVFFVATDWQVARVRHARQDRSCAERTEREARRLESILQANAYTDIRQLRADVQRDTDAYTIAVASQQVVYVSVINRIGEIILHTDRTREGAVVDTYKTFFAVAEPSTVVTRIEMGTQHEVCDVAAPLHLGGTVKGVLRMGFMLAGPDTQDETACAARSMRMTGVAAIVACFLCALACLWGLVGGVARRFEQRVLAERRSGEEKIEVIGAGIAHEVKNALNGIRMNAQLVQQQCASMPEEQRASLLKKLGRIEDEATRTGTMLGEFLTYAKPATFRPAPVNLVALLDDIAQFFEHACRERAIAITCSCHHSLTAVLADEQMLRHGLTNLMWNAIQAVEKGGTVTLKGERRGDTIALSVADTGGGIEPANESKVFDVFFSTKPRGAGLGLSIVQRVARMHGGEVALDNRPGKGCTFTILFPWRPA